MALNSFTRNELIVLQDSMQDAVNIKSLIESACYSSGVGPSSLPNSVIPTEQLYNILASFEHLYSKACDISLLKAGNLKSQRNNIH
jgi:hypothetical protein